MHSLRKLPSDPENGKYFGVAIEPLLENRETLAQRVPGNAKHRSLNTI